MPFIKSFLLFIKKLTAANKFMLAAVVAIILFAGQAVSLPANAQSDDAETPQNVVVYMGNHPLYSYYDENGEIAGQAVDMVKQIFEAAGLDVTLTVRPWSRAISMFEGDEHSFLMMLDRVPEREDRYTWISPLADQRFKLISRKRSDLTFKDKQDFITEDHKAVCYQNSSICEQLLKYGFSKENLVEVPNSLDNGLLRILQYGRADFIIMEENVLNWNQENFDGVWPFSVIDDVDFTMCSYLVGHKNMPDHLKQKLLQAVKSLNFDLLDKRNY